LRQHPRHEREPRRGEPEHDGHNDERCLQRGRIRQRANGGGASTTAIEDIATQLVVVRLSGVSTSCSVRW
jgi:hypothetical protein